METAEVRGATFMFKSILLILLLLAAVYVLILRERKIKLELELEPQEKKDELGDRATTAVE
jgi:hypothetical protein